MHSGCNSLAIAMLHKFQGSGWASDQYANDAGVFWLPRRLLLCLARWPLWRGSSSCDLEPAWLWLSSAFSRWPARLQNVFCVRNCLLFAGSSYLLKMALSCSLRFGSSSQGSSCTFSCRIRMSQLASSPARDLSSAPESAAWRELLRAPQLCVLRWMSPLPRNPL